MRTSVYIELNYPKLFLFNVQNSFIKSTHIPSWNSVIIQLTPDILPHLSFNNKTTFRLCFGADLFLKNFYGGKRFIFYPPTLNILWLHLSEVKLNEKLDVSHWLEPMFLGALGSYNTFNEFISIAMVTAPKGNSEP